MAVYEVANAIWKQDCLFKNLENGQAYLEYFFGLIDSGRITIIYPSENLMKESYLTAKRNGIVVYDSVFICLAIKLSLNLKTLDKKQDEIFKREKTKQPR